MIGTGLQLVSSLAVVVGLLLLIAKLSARRLGGRTGTPIEVLARQSISRGCGVVVVQVGGRVLVLGSTDQQVSLLTEIDPSELEIEPEPEPEGASVTDFSELVVRARRAESATAGSIVSVQTWRQAIQAVTGPRGRPPAGRRKAS